MTDAVGHERLRFGSARPDPLLFVPPCGEMEITMNKETLIPLVGVVTDIRRDTPDVKTFRVVGTDGKKPFVHIPGQCAMLSVPGVGEGMFSITSSPTVEEYMEFSIKKCGCLTSWLHMMEPGQEITIRGPYGNGFPVEGALKGRDLLFIAGGIGLAPLHSVINYVRAKRENYGSVQVIYGSRSADDLVHRSLGHALSVNNA